MKLFGNLELLRARNGHDGHVSSVELFFDLIYVFSVTQLSHYLLDHLTALGSLQTLIMLFAVWLAWQYNAWVTNWFNPETIPVRIMLFFVMLVGLVMAIAVPNAFGDGGLLFALCYVGIQLGRTVFVLLMLGSHHGLTANYHRILGWGAISGTLWIAGGLATPDMRLLFWAGAVACDYFAPMVGFRLPFLGRSRTLDWTIDGAHLAERCQLFIIVALGETILIMGATMAGHGEWSPTTIIAFLVSFIGCIAMWWIYFDTSGKDGSAAISRSDDPGRMGAYFHYIHVTMVAGIIVSAVANELVIAHPHNAMTMPVFAALIGGPAIYIIGNAIYKRVVYGRFPHSHGLGLALLALIAALAFFMDLLLTSALTTGLMLCMALWDGCSRRKPV